LGSQGAADPQEDETPVFEARDISQLVQETFRVYRANFVSFLLIALVPQVPLIPLAFVSGTEITALDIVAFAFSLVLSALAGGAMVCAVSQQYLDRPINVGDCFGRAWARVLSLILSTLVFFLAIIGAAITIIGIPVAIYLATVWFFFTEAIILERQGPMASLWHSRELVKGSFWRVFGIVLMIGATWIASVLAVTLLFEAASPVVGELAVTAVLTALAPIVWIGAILVYYDLRIRKHAYSIENLAQEMGEA
jgi:hypothetical protein